MIGQVHCRLSCSERRSRCPAWLSGAHGTAERAAIERVGSGGRFELIVAAAGAGKTTALKPLVAAWQEQRTDSLRGVAGMASSR